MVTISKEARRMPEDVSEKQEEPGTKLTDNKNLIIIGTVIVLLIIAVIAVIYIQSPPVNENKKPAAIKNITLQQTPVSSSYTPLATKTIRPTVSQAITQTSTIQATAAVPVDFTLQSGSPSSCGLTCRQLDASITNTGYSTAHSVCINVNMHNSRNEILNLNGDPTLSRCVGDIDGRQTKTESITINVDCGAFATKCIGETLTLQTQITSVEKTVRLPDQLIAV